MDIHRDIISWSDTCPFISPISQGQVIKVYDGDTITIASYMPYTDSPLFRFAVRLNGIDSPEIKGQSEQEKKAAKESRSALNDKGCRSGGRQLRTRLQSLQSPTHLTGFR